MSALSRILIVDDDPDIRKVLTLLLKDSYIVAEASDGPSAIGFHSCRDLLYVCPTCRDAPRGVF